MIHSVISWDCSFRNFFHLIDGLLMQEYDRDQFELIFVEQRTKEVADAYNHDLGLKSLWDRYEEVRSRMNIRVVYLGDPPSVPYHLGRCNNRGIEVARGDIISIMDGDLLVPPDFLKKLEEYHGRQVAVVNLYRHTAKYPVGASKENWTEQTVDFDLCLEACPTRNDPVPRRVDNKGPLISALREHWEAIGGYDLHQIWSTGLSRLGQDATARLEILTGVESTALPDTFAVHPFHPAGFNHNAVSSRKILGLQQDLIDWARSNREYSWRKRTPYTEKVYGKNRWLVDKMIHSERLLSSGKSSARTGSVFEALDVVLGKIGTKLLNMSGRFRER